MQQKVCSRCHNNKAHMRLVFYAAVISLFSFFRCEKDENENCLADMVITKATAVNTSGIQYGIILTVEAYGANLCYTYSHYDVRKTGEREYAIRIKATVPCGSPVCAQALVYANPSYRIDNAAIGVNTLNFYNGNDLFTSATVTVY